MVLPKRTRGHTLQPHTLPPRRTYGPITAARSRPRTMHTRQRMHTQSTQGRTRTHERAIRAHKHLAVNPLPPQAPSPPDGTYPTLPILCTRGLPVLHFLRTVTPSFHAHGGASLNTDQAAAAAEHALLDPEAILNMATSRSPSAVESCAIQQLVPSEVWHECLEDPAVVAPTPFPSLLQWLIALVKQPPVLQQLWIHYTKSRDRHLWQMVSDAGCRLFCQHMLTYFDDTEKQLH